MRKLRVSVEVLQFVAGHQDRIDALAFALFIKETRINSLITNATLAKLKKVFGMGSDTLRRVISNGVRWGFLRWEDKNLIANKLHNNKRFSLLLKRFLFVEQAQNSKRNRLTLCCLRSIVEEALFVNHVKKLDDCADTHVRAISGNTTAAIRCAKKRESRMLRSKSFNDSYVGISNNRIQQLIARKCNRAVNIVKQAISHGLVSKRVREIPFYKEGETYGAVMRAAMQGTNIIVWVQARSARIRLSNEYHYQGQIIEKSHHGK